MPLDLSDDYKTVDLYEPVTLVSRATAPGTHNEQISVARAFRRGLTTRELQASAGAAVRMETVFDVPETLVEGYTWKPGDTLTDEDENQYNIYNAVKDPGMAFWAFTVYNPKIAYDLRHTIDVFDLVIDKDSAGAATVHSEVPLALNVSCRVQWQSFMPGVHAGASGEIGKAVIILGEQLYLSHDTLIRWYESATKKLWTFEVKEWKNPDRLDELMQVRVEAVP